MTRYPNIEGTTGRSGAEAEGLRVLGERALGVFRAAGCAFVEPSILQAPEPFLDRSGEEIRQRMYAFSDPAGGEVCLRPDMTIPACRIFLQGLGDGVGSETRLCYLGPVFRHEPAGAGFRRQIQQAGVELLCAPDEDGADATALCLAQKALQELGVSDPRMVIGDVRVLGAFLDGLPIGERTRTRLARRVRRLATADDVLAALGGPESAANGLSDDFGRVISEIGPAASRSVVEEILALAGARPIGARTAEEIAERLAEKSADGSNEPISREIAEAVAAFMAVRGAVGACLDRAAEIATAVGARPIVATLEAFERRTLALSACGIGPGRYEADFGLRRGLAYYTGFVFEIVSTRSTGTKRVLAGGGRYDRLLRLLGAASDMPAVGFAVDLDNVALDTAAEGAR